MSNKREQELINTLLGCMIRIASNNLGDQTAQETAKECLDFLGFDTTFAESKGNS